MHWIGEWCSRQLELRVRLACPLGHLSGGEHASSIVGATLEQLEPRWSDNGTSWNWRIIVVVVVFVAVFGDDTNVHRISIHASILGELEAALTNWSGLVDLVRLGNIGPRYGTLLSNGVAIWIGVRPRDNLEVVWNSLQIGGDLRLIAATQILRQTSSNHLDENSWIVDAVDLSQWTDESLVLRCLSGLGGGLNVWVDLCWLGLG